MSSYPDEDEDKPCRACSDFKSWAKKQTKVGFTPTNKQTNPPPTDCPLDKDELGRATWGFLHSMASYYPEQPTRQQESDMARFFNIFAQFYPCEPCAQDFQAALVTNPVKTKNRHELEQWLCERHNYVNSRLNKPMFDCSKVHERWKEGWRDGSCN